VPLRIGEIGVRMAVRGPQDAGAGPARGGAAVGGCGGAPAPGGSSTDRETLLADCVRIVLETLRRQEAR